ncbi:MAG TPA: hypothetical protein VGB59_12520 [Allosphingosinicella sp.]|jgi:hypothetical protein
MNNFVRAGLAAAATTLLGAAAALAHPHPEGDAKRKIVIIETKEEKAGEHKGKHDLRIQRGPVHGLRVERGPVRELRVERDGKGEHVRRFRVESAHPGGRHGPHPRLFARGLEGCTGDRVVKEIGEEKDKTRIIVCSKGGEGRPAAEHLEQVLGRITANEHMSAEEKERIAERLREAISKLRSTN